MASVVSRDPATPSLKAQVSEEEWRTRVDLAGFYRLVALQGWNDHIFNHISARVPGPERHYLINPFGLFFDEITASSLVKIDLQGNVLADSTGLGINFGGYVIHGAIHEAREDAHWVVHVHTVEGVAVSGQKHGLLPLNQDALIVIDDVAYHDFEGIALDVAERKRMVANLGDKNLMILRNHGLLTLGETAALAFTRMYSLQKACANQIATLSAGAEVSLPTEAAQNKVRDQMTSGKSQASRAQVAELAWKGYRRKLDKIDQSYKD